MLSNSVKRIREKIEKFARNFDPQSNDRVRIPVGIGVHETLEQKIVRLVRDRHIQAQIASSGHETFEESEDFDVGDSDVMPDSPWEVDFDPLEAKATFEAGERFKRSQQAAPPRQNEKTPEPQIRAPEEQGEL